MCATSWRRGVRELLKRRLRGAFELGQRFGVDVLPRHFYSSIPDIHELRRTRHWRRPMEMVGVDGAGVEPQLAFADACCPPYLRQRLAGGGMDRIYSHACGENGNAGYGIVEAAFLYCFVSTRRPRKVIQVGAGVSTAVILLAAAEAGYDVEVVCVDPFPTDYLRAAAARGRVRLVTEPAQAVDAALLTDVPGGGLLFVDSTHTVKPGSEVNRIILDVLPRLPAGAFVHFHDIYFPYDYMRQQLTHNFFWSESTLLHAFLIHNVRYRIAASLSMLHYAAPDRLAQLLPGYEPAANDDGLEVPGASGHFPSATYLECIG